MNMEEIISISKENKEEAQFMSSGFIDKNVRNRIFLNVLGAEIISEYLTKCGIDAEELHSIHSIKRIIEKTDISDIILPNIHIDVRIVFDNDKIFIPKSHFELDITPDIYIILKFNNNMSNIDFLGYFEPKIIDFNNQNEDYYFVPADDLSSTITIIDFIRNFKNNNLREISDTQILRGRELSVKIADHDITDTEYQEFLNLLIKSDTLRSAVLEYDNFETLAYHVAKVMSNRAKEEEIKEKDGAIFDLDEFMNLDNPPQAEDMSINNITDIEDDINGDSLLDEAIDTAIKTGNTIISNTGSIIAAKTMAEGAVTEKAIELAGVAGDVAADIADSIINTAANVGENTVENITQIVTDTSKDENVEKNTENDLIENMLETNISQDLETERIENTENLVSDEDISIEDLDIEETLTDEAENNIKIDNEENENLGISKTSDTPENNNLEVEIDEISQQEEQGTDIQEQDIESENSEETKILDTQDLSEDILSEDFDFDITENLSETPVNQTEAENYDFNINDNSENEEILLEKTADETSIESLEAEFSDFQSEESAKDDASLNEYTTINEEGNNNDEQDDFADFENFNDLSFDDIEDVFENDESTEIPMDIGNGIDSEPSVVDEPESDFIQVEKNTEITEYAENESAAIEESEESEESEDFEDLEDFENLEENTEIPDVSEEIQENINTTDLSTEEEILTEDLTIAPEDNLTIELESEELILDDSIENLSEDAESVEIDETSTEQNDLLEAEPELSLPDEDIDTEYIEDLDLDEKPADKTDENIDADNFTENNELEDNTFENIEQIFDNINIEEEEEEENISDNNTEEVTVNFDDLTEVPIENINNTTSFETDKNTTDISSLPEDTNLDTYQENNDYGLVNLADLTEVPTYNNETNSEISYANIEDFSDMETVIPGDFTEIGYHPEEIVISDTFLNNAIITENSIVISDKTHNIGEIHIDINTQEEYEEDNNGIGELYNNDVVDGSGLNNDVRVVMDKPKAIPAGAIFIGIALILAVTGGILFSLSKVMAPQEQPQPIVGNDNNNNNDFNNNPNTLNIDNNNVVMNNNVEMNGDSTTNQAPIPNSIQSSQPAQDIKPSNPIPATSFLTIKKLSWEVPDYVSYDANFRQYFQSSGKSIKSALSSDLLLATDYTYSNQIKVSILFNKDGAFKQSRILTSSGSQQIDNIVLQSVNNTLKVLKAPNSLGNDESTTVILKIFL